MKGKIKLMVVMAALSMLAAAAAAVIVFPGTARVESKPGLEGHSAVNLPPGDPAAAMEEGDPRVESVLNRLAAVQKNEGQAAAAEFARQRKVYMKDNMVKVVVDARPFFSSHGRTLSRDASGGSLSPQALEAAVKDSAAAITDRIQRLGGRVDRIHNSMVQCNVGIQSLHELARMPQVRSVRRPIRARKHVESEGVGKTGAHHYHDLPAYKSNGARVCIIDAGFEGYRDLLGSELPDSVTISSFTEEGDIEAFESHGTACAEILHDMAPDAELFLANIYWNSEVVDALNWALQQDVDVISYSMGTYWGAGDGTGFFNSLARYAYNAGVTWVTSGGNSADDHWSGTFNDTDGDGWHNFYGADELLEFYVPADLGFQYGVDVLLKWDEWGAWDDQTGYSGGSEDYDLYLFIWDDKNGEWLPVDYSQNRQPDFIYPWESIEGWYATVDAYWGVAIRKHQAARNVYFDLYLPTHTPGSLEYNVPAGSVTSPADSPYIIAVGAVDAVEDFYHYYSSRGPTLDGRIKPDICAPSWVTTVTFSARSVDGFAGTSAACPHVAGAIALLKGKTPFTLDEILQILYSRAVDMGEPGADNTYCVGRLNLLN
jgi:subtilisin family serine protease